MRRFPSVVARLHVQPEIGPVATQLTESGGRRTVPEIFINGKIIGGFDELKALNDSGRLDGLLAESVPA